MRKQGRQGPDIQAVAECLHVFRRQEQARMLAGDASQPLFLRRQRQLGDAFGHDERAHLARPDEAAVRFSPVSPVPSARLQHAGMGIKGQLDSSYALRLAGRERNVPGKLDDITGGAGRRQPDEGRRVHVDLGAVFGQESELPVGRRPLNQRDGPLRDIIQPHVVEVNGPYVRQGRVQNDGHVRRTVRCRSFHRYRLPVGRRAHAGRLRYDPLTVGAVEVEVDHGHAPLHEHVDFDREPLAGLCGNRMATQADTAVIILVDQLQRNAAHGGSFVRERKVRARNAGKDRPVGRHSGRLGTQRKIGIAYEIRLGIALGTQTEHYGDEQHE